MWRFVPRVLQISTVLALGALVIGVTPGNLVAEDGRGSQMPEREQAAQSAFQAKAPASGQNSLNDAGQLLRKAVAAFEQDRKPDAQRKFEALVGGYPTSPEADIARRYLGRIYSAPAAAEAAVQLVAAEQQPSVAEMPGGAGASPDILDMKTSERLTALMRAAVGDRVFFSQGSTDLGLQARNVLRGQAGWLKQQHAGVKALVIGHADEPLDDEGNTILSARRAEAVRARLIEEGVAPERVSVTALGRSERVADCSSVQCKAQNRRVVTTVLEGRAGTTGSADSRGYYQTPKEGDAPAGW